MHYSIPNDFKCMIIDLGSVIYQLDHAVLKVFSDIYKNDIVLEVLSVDKYKYFIIKSFLFNSLRDVFTLPVLLLDSEKSNNYYNELTGVNFNFLRTLSDSLVFNNIDRVALSMFDNCEIVPFIREHQLYLFSNNVTRPISF